MPKPTVGTPYKCSEGSHLTLVMRGRQCFSDFVCLFQVVLEVFPPAVARSAERADQHLVFERVLHFPMLFEASVTIDLGWYTCLADE